MTAEKSIKILKAVKELKDDAIYTLTDLTEAYNMAIEALSKQCASSEQADHIAEPGKMIKLKKRTITERLIIAESLINSVIADSDQFREDTKMTDDVLINLPSAQPETNCSEIPNNSGLISRQMAIDDLKDKDPSQIWDTADIEVWINALPSAQPEQRWIPCSERLPDNDESVLISNSHGVTKAWWNGRFWTSIAVKKYKTVTAWMPLPKSYQEDVK